MWLKGSYSKVIHLYLLKYRNIKIHLNNGGKIVKIEKKQNGFWLLDNTMSSIFRKLPANPSIKRDTTITLSV